MSDKDSHLKNPETQKRLALLMLAAERREAGHECIDDERFALLLEADPGSAEQQQLFDHLSACASCREKWLVLSEELDRSHGHQDTSGFLHRRRGLMSIVGSACAVAVGVMLYLAIDYHPVRYEDNVTRTPAHQAPAPAAENDRVDGFKKEAEGEKMGAADVVEMASEPTRSRREAQMEQPAEVKPGSAPQMADALEERRSKGQQFSNRQSFSVASGAMKHPVQFGEYIDSFLSYCADQYGEKSLAVRSADLLEQGKALLDREKTIARDEKAMIDKIIQLLSSTEPVKDIELDKLCDEAARMAAETGRAPR